MDSRTDKSRLSDAWRAVHQSGDDLERIKMWWIAEENRLQILWEERILGPTMCNEPSMNV